MKILEITDTDGDRVLVKEPNEDNKAVSPGVIALLHVLNHDDDEDGGQVVYLDAPDALVLAENLLRRVRKARDKVAAT